VPSQTELLCALGAQERLAGITKFCIHPDEAYKSIPHIGGTKNVNIEKLAAVKPDLIIGNKEENTQAEIEALSVFYPVWMSDIHTLEEALTMIVSVGTLVQADEKAHQLVEDIRSGFNRQNTSLPNRTPSALYLIWREPWMAAGDDTFIHDMLKYCGYKNVLNTPRYPTLTNDDIQSLNPDVVLLSSEPYPFGDKHIAEIKELLPNAKVMLVDGEMFSWYGSRLQFAPAYFKSLSPI